MVVGALVKPSLSWGTVAEEDLGVRKALLFWMREGKEGAIATSRRLPVKR